MLQWPRSPRSHPKKPRFSNSVSSRSVFARRCSRDTATLEGWITCASTPRASSQRASQKPSRPASKATAIRVIVPPAWTASSRQRCSTASSRSGLGSSFLCGCRSIPGTTPPRSQLDWLSSTTEMIVLFWSRATRDLLKSFGWGIAALHRLHAATKLPRPRRPPHSVFRFRKRVTAGCPHACEKHAVEGRVPHGGRSAAVFVFFGMGASGSQEGRPAVGAQLIPAAAKCR